MTARFPVAQQHLSKNQLTRKLCLELFSAASTFIECVLQKPAKESIEHFFFIQRCAFYLMKL